MKPVDNPPPTLADHATGKGPPMLLLHGGTGSHRHWVRVVPALAQHFSVVAPDLPGYGESPDVPRGIGGDDYVVLAAAGLGKLVPAAGVHLVGFSFGGALAAGVARAWGERVERLTLIGPGGFGKPIGRDIPMRTFKDTDGSPAARREVARHNLQAMILADPALIDEAVATARSTRAAYVSNIPEPTYPKGLEVEAASAHALGRAASGMDAEAAAESSPMRWLRTRPAPFPQETIHAPRNWSEMDWRVRTPADLAFTRRDMSRGTEPGAYTLYVGGDSTATQSATFTILPT